MGKTEESKDLARQILLLVEDQEGDVEGDGREVG